MENRASNWIDYWDRETIWQDILKKTVDIFVSATEKLLNYNNQDIILDIGCGPGYLETLLKGRVKKIYCLDTSERYLDICRKKFERDQNIFIYKLDKDNYTDLSFLKNEKFSIIICLSVIQYYNSITDVKKLINEVRRLALPGAKFLIADIPTKTGMFSDICVTLLTGLRERYSIKTIKFLFRATISEYHKVRPSFGLLNLSIEDLKQLTDELDLEAELLSMRMSINTNRKHLLIKF